MNYFYSFDKMEYVQGKRPDGCILCLIRDHSDEVVDLSVYSDELFTVTVNLYPYNPGHVMIFPNRHIVDIRQYTDAEQRSLADLTNRVLTSAEALDWGLVNEIVSDEEVLLRARELAGQLATGPTGSYAAVKRLMVASQPGLESQMALEGNTIATQSMTEEAREGIAAFLGKRKPSFS